MCPNDPRTRTQRRADALTPLVAGAASMPCTCGSKDCPAASCDRPAPEIVINVLADAATVEGTSTKPGYLPGYGVLPAAMVTELANHATLRPVIVPKDLVAQPHYRPSAALARFIRCRDLTCRFPGCDQPRSGVRYRPHRALSTRAHPSVEHQAVLPNPLAAQDEIAL